MALNTTCGNCGVFVAAKHVTGDQNKTTVPTFWTCPNCGSGMVKQASGAVYPPAPAGATVPNLPQDVQTAWQEARVAHNVAAYTAAEIMCRKILMHVAVDKAESKTHLSFKAYVEALEAKGFIAAGLKPTVDAVRDRGNEANHEIPASTEENSLQTLRITQHLLESLYAFGPPTPAP